MAAPAKYGPNPHAGASVNNAQARGWGTGWPHAQTSKMTTVTAAGVKVSVRREVAALVQTLLLVTEKYGYDVKAGQTWGFANRPIAGTKTASNHSWGLAVDVNSIPNRQGTPFKSDLPPKVVSAWESCGFYWGGRYTKAKPDPMHFEYIGTPKTVATHLAKAKAMLTPVVAPPLDLSLLMKQWRIDKGKKPTETLSASEKHWIGWYRRSYAILLTRKGVKFNGSESFVSLTTRFQRAYGLAPDGVPGPKTADMLRRLAGYRVQP
ncbi:M15 family metallopeptidase [Kribbella sp. NPDC056861]|uniref:M15 family metallopeptidase n=1 Tax=Kribbella sp. NPDC056861 TaxID=3154857 RepID=UPI0034225422